MYKFYLPFMSAWKHLYINLLGLFKNQNEVFNDDFTIAGIYGAFQGSLWNGGRVMTGYTSITEVEAFIKAINSYGVPFEFTFTNSQLQEKHLNDTFCNLCLDAGNNGMNEVLVNSPILEKYIRKHYPNYKISSSTTKCITKPNDVKREAAKDYKLIAIDYNFNNTDYLFNLPNKERYEILINACCRDHCPTRKAHYDDISRWQLRNDMANQDFYHKKCHQEKYVIFYSRMAHRHFITRELLNDKYFPAGFRHFKIEGRTDFWENVVESISYYMIKPEERDYFRLSGCIQYSAMTNRK
jgi:collagenase-like PrtC family protease